MCHFYSFRQSAPKPSVGIISHLCHYATCILHKLGNFIKRILVCCFWKWKETEAQRNFQSYGGKKTQAKPERLTLKNILVQKSVHQDSDYSPEQNSRKACRVPPHSEHPHNSETPDLKRPFLLHLSENQVHSRSQPAVLAFLAQNLMSLSWSP